MATTPSRRKPKSENIASLIYMLRGEKVLLSEHLAGLYGVSVGALNQAVKRNIQRFPDDFMFQLTREEANAILVSRSQIVILKQGRNVKHLPFAFTEHGAIMAANILNSPQAIQMSVFVVRAFIKMRAALTDTRELARKLAALEKELTSRLDTHESAIVDVLQRIMALLDPPPPPPTPPAREMGFHTAIAKPSKR